MLCQYLQDPPDHSFVFFFCLCKDQNVIQVHYYNPFSYEGSKDVVYHSLEGSRTVGHSEEHHERFKEAAIGTEGCLLFISGLDAHIVETPVDVKFYEVLGSMELGDKFGDEGKGVFILDGYGVQHMIVLN